MRFLPLLFLVFCSFSYAQDNMEVLFGEWGANGAANQLSYSRDGKAIAFNRDGTVLLCDVRTGKIVWNFRTDFSAIKLLTLSPNRTFLAAAAEGAGSKGGSMVQIWNLSDGSSTMLQLHDEKKVTALTFSPDGKYLASGGANNDIYLFELKSNLELNRLVVFDKEADGHRGNIRDLKFTPDGSVLLSSANDNTVKLWDMSANALLKTIDIPEGDIFSIDIGPDGRYIVGGGRDNKVRLWDMEGAEAKVFEGHEKNISQVLFSPDGKTVISAGKDRQVKFWNLDGELIHAFDVEEQEMLATKEKEKTDGDGFSKNITMAVSPDGKYLAFSRYFEMLGFAGSFHKETNYAITLFDILRKRAIRSLPELASSPIRQLFFSRDGRRLCTFTEDRYLQVLNLEEVKQELVFQVPDTTLQGFVVSPDWEYILYQHLVEKEASATDPNTRGKVRYELCALPAGAVPEGAYSYADRQIIQVMPPTVGMSPAAFSPDGRWLALAEDKGDHFALNIWDLSNRESPVLSAEIPIAYFQPSYQYASPVIPVHFSMDSRYLVIGASTKVMIYQVGEWEELQGVLNLEDEVSDIFRVRFIDRDRSLCVFYRNPKDDEFAGSKSITFTNLTYPETGEEEPEKKKGFGRKLFNVMDKMAKMEGEAGELDPEKDLGISSYSIKAGSLFGYQNAESPVFSSDGDFWVQPYRNELTFFELAGIEPNMIGEAKARDAEKGRLPGKKLLTRTQISTAAVSPDTRFLAVGAENGSIELLQLSTGEKIATIALAEEEYIFLTPDNYYATSRDGGKLVIARVGRDYYPFDALDVKYNRPDLVWKTLTDPKTGMLEQQEETAYKFEAYYQAYLKRLQKMGLKEADLESGFEELPGVEILNIDQLPIETTERLLPLELKLSDPRHNISNLHVYVNDVPVYGSAGLDLREKAGQDIEQTIQIPLSYGDNQIQVMAVNDAGTRSFRETIPNISLQGEQPLTDIYLITIGVSEYQDPQMNLRFAGKDATEVARLFEVRNNYRDVHLFKLLDQEATRDNILALSKELEKSQIDDQVVIYFAGHGMYDAEYNYYLGTHDINFEKPSERGLSYEELLSLLDGIPARNKLLLLDACHSGEIDPDNVERVETVLAAEEDITFRAFDNATTIQEKQVGLENSFELMKTLFADLREGTGSAVIAAAGGAEYAREGGGVENGIFTYVLMKGLGDKEADQDGDGRIRISELQSYLNRKVAELTHNQQRPTARTKRFSNDWMVW